MSRDINLDKKLSEEDRQYLLDRGQEQLVAELDREFAGVELPERDPFGGPISDEPTGDVGFDKELSGHRDTIVNETRRPESDAGDQDVDGDTTEEIPPYEDWSNEKLREECKTRGLSATGKKDELVARLEENDEAEAAS